MIYRERDTAPEEVAMFMTEGDWVQLVMGGTEAEPEFRVGPDIVVQGDPVVPGESVLISASEVPTLGMLDVQISSDSSLEFVGDQLVLNPGASARSIGTVGISYGVPEDGMRVGFDLVSEIPLDTPPGDYRIILVGDQAGAIPHYSSAALTVVEGSPEPGTEGTVAITGRARLHDTLTAVTTGWDPAATLVYQWYANGEPIVRGTQPTLVLDYYENSKSRHRRGRGLAGGPLACGRALRAHRAGQPRDLHRDLAADHLGRLRGRLEAHGRGAPGLGPDAPASPIRGTSTTRRPVSTGTTYTIKPTDVGKSIAVLASSKRIGFHDSSYFSLWSAPVAPGILTPPTNVDLPKIAGTPRVGNTLTAEDRRMEALAELRRPVDARRPPDSRCDRVDIRRCRRWSTATRRSVVRSVRRSSISSTGYLDATANLLATGLVTEGVFYAEGRAGDPRARSPSARRSPPIPACGTPVATLSYQWEIVNVGIVSTDPTFVIPAAAQNRKIRLTVTASAPGYLTVVRSAVTATKVP